MIVFVECVRGGAVGMNELLVVQVERLNGAERMREKERKVIFVCVAAMGAFL